MAFKTVLARIGDAVPDAVDGMAKFGINVSGNAFRTATFSDKLRLLNEKQKEVFHLVIKLNSRLEYSYEST